MANSVVDSSSNSLYLSLLFHGFYFILFFEMCLSYHLYLIS